MKNTKKQYQKRKRKVGTRPDDRRRARSAPKRPLARKRQEVGCFSGSRRGFGFVIREQGGADVFIPAARTRGALDGDTVRFVLFYDGERPEGEVTEIIARAHTTAVGEVVRDCDVDLAPRGEIFLLPDNPRLPLWRLPPRGKARVGDKIEVRLPSGSGDAVFLRSFGQASTRAANYASILAECEIPTEFSEEACREAENRACEAPSREGRRLFPNAPILTIDSEGAKDLDDAISLTKEKDGYRLYVHIADVSHYVRPFGALDATAHERGSSVYFADRVVPMLPEALSNGACSLNAGEEKYTLTAEMQIDMAGNITKTHLYRSLIKSRVRGVYREVNDLFGRGEASPFYPKYRSLYPTLLAMRELYALLSAAASRRGVMELETKEPAISLDEEGEPCRITVRERGEAERLIEAFMLAANRGVAECLTARGVPCVYRVHDAPPPEKYEGLAAYLSALSLPLPWRRGEEPTAAALGKVLQEAGERGLALPVSLTLLRSMAKARYSAEAAGHFGLALPLYTHFTSPIRRLSDLVTHRIIKAVLLDGERADKYRAPARRAATAATEGELRALTAERRIEALYKTIYMKKHIGEVFEGFVSSCTSFGYYVELPNTCEGLVPLSLLEGEWHFDETRRTLVSPNATISIGDRAVVRVRDADVPRGRVTFEPQEDAGEKPKPASPAKRAVKEAKEGHNKSKKKKEGK